MEIEGNLGLSSSKSWTQEILSFSFIICLEDVQSNLASERKLFYLRVHFH